MKELRRLRCPEHRIAPAPNPDWRTPANPCEAADRLRLEAETARRLVLARSATCHFGIQVARTIYETLTIPNDEGE